MSLNIPNAPNANLFKGGYNKSVYTLLSIAITVTALQLSLLRQTAHTDIAPSL